MIGSDVVGVGGERRRLRTGHHFSTAGASNVTARQSGACTPQRATNTLDSNCVAPSPCVEHHTVYLHVFGMTDATKGAPAPKKRSLFKRAAWQDAAKKEDVDIFSHSNEFKDIIAEESRRKEEEKRKQAEAKRKAEVEEKREQAEKLDKKGKRRKMSTDYEEPILLPSGSPEPGSWSRSLSAA